MPTSPFKQHFAINAVDLGLNGVALDANRTSNWFSVDGWTHLEQKLQLTHGGGATTATTWYFEASDDGGTTSYRLRTSSVVSGTETLSNHTVSVAFTADDDIPYSLGLRNNDLMRIVLVSTGDANDLATCSIVLGVV